MESRTEKYVDENQNLMSRTNRNAKLYNDISDAEITDFDVNSNATILGTSKETIDIDKLRDMLDKKYRLEPQNKSIGDPITSNDSEKVSLDETREYDINTILNAAKNQKDNSDYEIERLKKLRNTQIDILNSLDINDENLTSNESDSKAVSNTEGQKIMELINTINLTEATNSIQTMGEEKTNKELDPLDILSDLKGNNDETIVAGADKTKSNENIDKSKLDNSFYTTTNMFTQSDFDDFNDLKEEVTSTKIIIKILIIVVILAFIAGIIFLLNRILGWGLF